MVDHSKFRILVAEGDALLGRSLSDFLTQFGFACKTTFSGSETRQLIETWEPHFVVIDIVFPEMNAFQLLRHLKKSGDKFESKTGGPQVIVSSRHNSESNVSECLRLGAVDYVTKPYIPEIVANRILFHCRTKREVAIPPAPAQATTSTVSPLTLMDMVLRTALSGQRQGESLYNLVRMLGMAVKAARCSIVECHRETMQAIVVASSDRADARGIVLDLNNYPEMITALNTQKAWVVESLKDDPVMLKMQKNMKDVKFNSIVVCPVYKSNQIYGVVSVRMAEEQPKLTDEQLRFTQNVAHVISIVLSADWIALRNSGRQAA